MNNKKNENTADSQEHLSIIVEELKDIEEQIAGLEQLVADTGDRSRASEIGRQLWTRLNNLLPHVVRVLDDPDFLSAWTLVKHGGHSRSTGCH